MGKYCRSRISDFSLLLISLLLILASLLDSTKTSGTACSDQTTLSSRGTCFTTSRWHTNVLVVSSSVGMLYWILRHTTNLGPVVALHSILVVSVSGLQKRLVGTSTSSYNADLCTYSRGNSFLSSGGKTETGGSFLVVVGNNNSEGSRSTSKSTTITNLRLNVAHDCSLGYRGEGKHVSYGESSFLSTVNVLSGVHTLGTKHKLVIPLETVCIEELNLSYWSSTTGVMHDFLHNSTDVSVLLSVVNGTELHRSLTGTGVSLEDGGLTLPLCLSFD
jgi:hypothetical protein